MFKMSRGLTTVMAVVLSTLLLMQLGIVQSYGADLTDSIKIQNIPKVSEINEEDYTFQIPSQNQLKKSVASTPDATFSLSGEELAYKEDGPIEKFVEITDESIEIINSNTGVTSSSAISATLSPIVSAAASLPDLTVISLVPNGTHPFTALGEAQIKITLSNIGTATSAVNACIILLDNKPIYTFNMPSLPGNYSYAFTLTLPNVRAGSHTFGVQTDSDNTVSESNETNNISSVVFDWVGSPDLTITLEPSVTTPVVGVSTTFNFSIKNIGNDDANGTFYIPVMLDTASIGQLTVSNIPAQKTANGSFSLTFNKNGTYKIVMEVDGTNVIQESNENNNSYTRIVTTKIADTVTITGTLRYRSYENFGQSSTLHNLSNYPIEIYDNNAVGEILKASDTTDSNGNFTVTIDNAINPIDNGCDIFLVVPMNNSYARISDPRYPSDFYKFESGVIKDQQEPTLALNAVTIDQSELMKGALNIYHWIKVTKDFYESKGNSLGKINIEWLPTGTENSHLDASGSPIVIKGVSLDHYSSTVIAHEYGHYIMFYNGVNPNNAGGTHYLSEPSLYTGTAYSEGYATFISLSARNREEYESYSPADSFFGANFETLKLLSPSSNEDGDPVDRREVFYENALMELFTGGAMLDFADANSDGYDIYNGGFNDVDTVVNSERLNNSIEFYDAYMDNTNPKDRVSAWKIFNQNNSAFDYLIPEVNIVGDPVSGYAASASDNVGIAKIEWYLDDALVATGSYYNTSNLPAGTYTLSVRAYDYEGLARGNSEREDIDGESIRDMAFNTDSLTFNKTGSSSHARLITLNDLNYSIPTTHEFESSNIFEFTSPSQNSRSIQNNKLAITDNTDLYITGRVKDAVKNINIISEDTEVAANIEGGLYTNEYMIARNLPAGNYTLEINTADGLKVPYAISVFAVPANPELTLPRMSNKGDYTIDNPYGNQLHISVNDRGYTIKPYESQEISFDEGENLIKYYSENANGRSEITEEVLYCDTIAPEVKIIKAVSNGEVVVFSGTISEYAENFYINGEHIQLGEFYPKGEPITFEYIAFDTDISTLKIQAADDYGHTFSFVVNLVQ